MKVVEVLGADLIDVRYRAGSRNPAWNKTAMQRFFGPAYWHCRELGNVNYRSGGPIKLNKPEEVAPRIGEILQSKPVILLCACKETYTCHRHNAAQYLRMELGAKVSHLSAFEVADIASNSSRQLDLFQQEIHE
jgi:hypothetical protein